MGGREGGRACPRIPGAKKRRKLAQEALEIEAEEARSAGVGYTIAHKHQLWWSPRDPEQRPL